MTTPSEFASKLVGKVRSATATLRGEKGIFRKLKEEHAEIALLLNRVSASADPDLRAELFPRIRIALIAHTKAEQAEFYGVLSEYEATRAATLHAIVEHEEIEGLLAQIGELGVTDAAWPGLFDSMMRMVEQHVSEEEHELFHEARKVLTDRQVDSMEHRFEDRRRAEEQRLSS